MDEAAFKLRTKRFAIDVLTLAAGLPRTGAAAIISDQLVRAATAVGANYRAACRAQSLADMLRKLSFVEEEADEAGYWLELLAAVGHGPGERVEALRSEADEITAMTVASKKTLKQRFGDESFEGPRPLGNRKSQIGKVSP
jgi:four helix bundle protein